MHTCESIFVGWGPNVMSTVPKVWCTNHMQEKIKGNRPATSNGRENIHRNLPKCECVTNKLWTLYKQIMNKSPLDRSFNFNLRLSPKSFCPSALRYLCLFLLPQAVFLSFVVSLFSSPVCLLSHASVGLWTMHEQFMNNSWTMLDWLSWPILGTNPSESGTW